MKEVDMAVLADVATLQKLPGSSGLGEGVGLRAKVSEFLATRS